MSKNHHIPKNVRLLLGSNILSHIGNGVSMIALPWLLVKYSGGNFAYALAVILVNLISTILLPYIGMMIDRLPRKRMLIFSELLGFGSNFIFALIFLFIDPSMIALSILIFTGGFLRSIHYPARFAFAQELVPAQDYNKVNSWLEIQGQSAFVIAGGLGGFMADRFGIEVILFFDAFTYILGIILLSLIQYTPQKIQAIKSSGQWQRIREGYQYLKKRPDFTVFFLAAAMPFVGTMTLHYIIPIHLSNTLQTDSTVLGFEETFWSLGAISVSIILPMMSKKFSTHHLLLVTFFIFLTGNFIMGSTSSVIVIVGTAFFLGFGNSGSRVARNTLLMNETNNHVMGRVASIIMGFNKLMQVVMIGTASFIVKYFDTYWAFFFIGCMMVIAFLTAYKKRKIFDQKKQLEYV